MASVALTLSLVVVIQVLPAPGLEYFPGSYFTASARSTLEQYVLTVWPGPSGLLALWHSGGLDEGQQVAVLLGGAAFHDPVLLPAYLDGIVSASPRVRVAAAYGYRELLADAYSAESPDAAGIEPGVALALEREMESVALTLRVHSLVELWLNALLENEGRRMPGWSGVVLRRPGPLCGNALDRLLAPEDLHLVLVAYQVAEEAQNRERLMSFIEGLALEQLVLRPRDPTKALSINPYLNADRQLRAWLENQCGSDDSALLAARLSAVARARVSPQGAEACGAWEQVLLHGEPLFWPAAARQLYRCGGPPVSLSMLRHDMQQNKDQRAFLLGWFRVAAESVPR